MIPSFQTAVDIGPEVLEAIKSELDYQKKRWGDHGRGHEVASWITYMRSYLEEAANQVSRSQGHDEALETLRKVVTLGVACMKEHGAPLRQPERVTI